MHIFVQEANVRKKCGVENVYFGWIFIVQKTVLGQTYELIIRKSKFFLNTKCIARGFANSLC